MATWGSLQFLQEILAAEAVSQYQKDRKQKDYAIVHQLATEEGRNRMRMANISDFDGALTHDAIAIEVKPRTHLYLLHAKSIQVQSLLRQSNQQEDTQLKYQKRVILTFLSQLSNFFFQIPVHVATGEISNVCSLCRQYIKLLKAEKQSIAAIYPLKSLLRRLHSHGHIQLTPIHSYFLQICLDAKCYTAAMDVLKTPIFEVHSQTGLVSSEDYLAYAYYGGNLYLGQRDYQNALEFFTLALSAPAVAISAYTVASYKKMILTALLFDGSEIILSKYTPFIVSRHIDAFCEVYLEFSRCFRMEKDYLRLSKLTEDHVELFQNDNNWGLVKQCLAAFQAQNLQQLTDIYTTIPLQEIKEYVGIEQMINLKKMIMALNEKEKFHGMMDTKLDLVQFIVADENSEVYRSSDQVNRSMELQIAKLQQEMNKLHEISRQWRTVDRDIVKHPSFMHAYYEINLHKRRIKAQLGDQESKLSTNREI